LWVESWEYAQSDNYLQLGLDIGNSSHLICYRVLHRLYMIGETYKWLWIFNFHQTVKDKTKQWKGEKYMQKSFNFFCIMKITSQMNMQSKKYRKGGEIWYIISLGWKEIFLELKHALNQIKFLVWGNKENKNPVTQIKSRFRTTLMQFIFLN